MGLRRKLTWFIVGAVVCVVTAWWTFPAILYAFYYFVYPLYYYAFRYRSVVREFSMRWEALPSAVVDGRRLVRPVWLRFEDNLNYGMVVEARELRSVRGGKGGTVQVLLSVHGDRRKGAVGLRVQSIGGEPYSVDRPVQLRIGCEGTCPNPGPSPLDTAICQGPCREHELSPARWP